ncbi:hypothetical protein WMY93_009632 [Mugilogobius chulae]|uniref:Reverse transcriptase domain-containing protein n=1 Tax=Mugilogobius chulae TaxID=88201 RepID=A0AAW0PMP7_9GOBI
MIDFVVVSSDLRPRVLDTRVKRGAELSTDHHLVVSWIRWQRRKLDRPGRPKRIGGSVGNVWRNPLSDGSSTHTSGRASPSSRVRLRTLSLSGHVLSLHCQCGCSELWSQGLWCFSWRPSPNPVVAPGIERYRPGQAYRSLCSVQRQKPGAGRSSERPWRKTTSLASKKFWQTVRRLRRGKQFSTNTIYSAGGELLTSTGDVSSDGGRNTLRVSSIPPPRLPMRKQRLRTRGKTHPSPKLKSLRVLERRIRPMVEPRIQEEQCGFRPGRGTLDQLYTLHRVLEGSWEFAHQSTCALWIWRRHLTVSLVVSVGSAPRVWGPGPFAQGGSVPVRSEQELCSHCRQISRRSQGPEGVQFGDHRISSLLFADDVVLMASSNQDLQHALGRCFAPLQVGGESLPQVEEFKYLGVLFTSEGRMEREIDRRIGAASAVMRSLYRTVVVKKELSRKAKLSIYRSIYVPTLTYGHELWVMTERTRSRIQAVEMSFLRRVAGRSLRDRVRSSVTREELGVEPLLLHVERSQLRWLGHLFRMPPGRLPGEVFRACPTGRRPRGRPRTRWRDYVSRLTWERLGIPPEELAEVCGDREVWASLLRLLPPRPDSG